jgi:hypothetical protein
LIVPDPGYGKGTISFVENGTVNQLLLYIS